MGETGHRGSSRGHKERCLSSTFIGGSSKRSAMASNVPGGASVFELVAGAFPDGLNQS